MMQMRFGGVRQSNEAMENLRERVEPVLDDGHWSTIDGNSRANAHNHGEFWFRLLRPIGESNHIRQYIPIISLCPWLPAISRSMSTFLLMDSADSPNQCATSYTY